MEKLINAIRKELKEIENQGFTANNLEMAGELVDMLKDLTEIQKNEEGDRSMRGYGHTGYMNWDYNDGSYNRYNENYGRRGVPGSGRDGYRGEYREGYGGDSGRMNEHLMRIQDGAEMYQLGRDRYRHGGNDERMYDGLEKLMYAICMFVESTMDFAESPEEKEIIRKHVQKLKNI